MNKNKVLGISVVILIILNIGILLFFTMSRPPHPPHGGPGMGPQPKEMIIHELDLDHDQIEAYDELISEHRAAIHDAEESMRTSRQALFETLKSDNQSLKDSLIQVIGENQKRIESIHYNHFEDIKKLLKPDQLNNFESLVEELEGIFKPRPPRP